ncbi:MAG: diguanylate cyclase [Syntrophales bacterium]|jgi:diguanylate cyclase (GGDEF)-like protein|nr:diguanylate cyclase [Syntrophales bacterium]MCK9527534.1 diguanylate cyclase [Syntrophales bacterium]MDX9922591.1 diguanylate cyclase [Syntrophales bacterium]
MEKAKKRDGEQAEDRGIDMSGRRIIHRGRRESDQILAMIMEGTPIPTFVIDKNHRIIYWNKAMEALTGIPADDLIAGEGNPWTSFYDEKRPSLADILVSGSRETVKRWYPDQLKQSDVIRGACEVTDFFPTLGDSGMWLRCTAALLRWPTGEIFGAIETLEDVTDRFHSEEELRKSEAFLASVLQGSSIPTFVIDRDHRITYWNQALEGLSQITARDVIGTSDHWKAFYDHERPCMADLLLDERTGDLNEWYGETFSKSALIDDAYEATTFFPALGERGRWLRFTAAILRDSDGTVLGALETLEDVTPRILAEEALKASEKKYKNLSITDGLTKLFNGRHFYRQMHREMERAGRYLHDLSILFFDIDDFKKYNDTFGHLEGDEVLVRLADVTRRCLRKTDSAYRFGGEEFTAVLPETDGPAAVAIAERIRQEFKREQFNPGFGEPIQVTVSIGVVQYSGRESLPDIIRRADMNMYQAKAQGKDRVFFK